MESLDRFNHCCCTCRENKKGFMSINTLSPVHVIDTKGSGFTGVATDLNILNCRQRVCVGVLVCTTRGWINSLILANPKGFQSYFGVDLASTSNSRTLHGTVMVVSLVGSLRGNIFRNFTYLINSVCHSSRNIRLQMLSKYILVNVDST